MDTIIFRTIWLLIVLIALASCQQSIKDIEVTEENRETLFEEIKDSKDLYTAKDFRKGGPPRSKPAKRFFP